LKILDYHFIKSQKPIIVWLSKCFYFNFEETPVNLNINIDASKKEKTK